MSIRNLLDFGVAKPDWVNLRCNDLRCDQELFVTGDTTITGAFGANDINCNNLTAGANIQTDTLNTTGEATINELVVDNASRFKSLTRHEAGIHLEDVGNVNDILIDNGDINITQGDININNGEVVSVAFTNPVGSSSGGPINFNYSEYTGSLTFSGPWAVDQTVNYKASKVGNNVTLEIRGFSAPCINNAVALSTNEINVDLRPSDNTINFLVRVEDLGAFENGNIEVLTNGKIEFGLDADGGPFTIGGDCGSAGITQISYVI